MFTSFEESNKDHVAIRELDSTALILLVDFIYTAQIMVTEENVQVQMYFYFYTRATQVRYFLFFLTIFRFCYLLQIFYSYKMCKMHVVTFYNLSYILLIVLVSRHLPIYMVVWNCYQVLNHIFNNISRKK